jgi:hypothetical protein
MRKILSAAILPILVGACGSAATVDTTGTRAIASMPTADAIPVGTMLRVQLNQPIVNGHLAMDDPFTFTVIEPVHDANGQIVVPTGTVIDARVTGYSAGVKPEPSAVRLAIESVSLNEMMHPLSARITNVDLALTDADVPTVAITSVPASASTLAPVGTIIYDPGSSEVILNRMGHGPGTVLSLGTDPHGGLPVGARITLIVEPPEAYLFR